MSELDLLALAPVAILLGGALACLSLEAAGTPIGARKRGARTHLALISISAALAAAAVIGLTWPEVNTSVVAGGLQADRVGRAAAQIVLAILVISLAGAMPSLRHYRGAKTDPQDAPEERGEIYALLLLSAAGFTTLAMASDLIMVAASITLAAVPVTGILVVDRRSPRGAEAAVKLLHSTLVSIALLALGSALIWGEQGFYDLAGVSRALHLKGWSLVGGLACAAALLAWLPAVVLHAARVDVVHGGPGFVVGFYQAAALVTGAALLIRTLAPAALSERYVDGLTLVTLLTLLIPAIAALDQRTIDRLCAHLSIGQAGVVLLPACLLAAGHPGRAGLTLICAAGSAAAIVGIMCALSFLEPGARTRLSWEEWSGLGRRQPIFALGLLWLLGSLAGFPGTAGFAARLGTARAAFEDGADLIGWMAAIAPAVIAIPVLRFGIFLFAKAPGSRCVRPVIEPWRVLVVAVCCALVLVLGVAPEPLWARFLVDLVALQ